MYEAYALKWSISRVYYTDSKNLEKHVLKKMYLSYHIAKIHKLIY